MTREVDLLERAAAGDVDALEELLREVAPSLRREISIEPHFQRCFDVEDVLQVTFLEAFLRIRSLQQRTPAGFRAWLRRIAENNLRDAIRALERDKRPKARDRVTRGPHGESARTLLFSLAGSHATAGGQAALAEDIERLHRAIAELPASYRRIVEQVDLRERSVAEVARELERSEGAVYMLRSRAHERLQELLRA